MIIDSAVSLNELWQQPPGEKMNSSKTVKVKSHKNKEQV